jgi:hypothetical protein
MQRIPGMANFIIWWMVDCRRARQQRKDAENYLISHNVQRTSAPRRRESRLINPGEAGQTDLSRLRVYFYAGFSPARE